MANDYRSENAEQIQARLFDEAARVYERRSGKRLNRLGGFDPLVYMMLGAAASEFEKVSADLHSSWARMLEQLAHLLTPEVQTGPQPAHGIAHACPLDTGTVTRPADQMIAKHQGSTFYLSPTGHFPLSQSQIRYIHLVDTLYEIDGQLVKTPLARVQPSAPSSPFVAWIALDGLMTWEELESLHFFWEWDHQRLSVEAAEWLLTSQWEHDGQPLEIRLGLEEATQEPAFDGMHPIEQEFFAARRVEQAANLYYQDRFLKLRWSEGQALRHGSIPDELKGHYGDEVNGLPQDLFWIKIQFSPRCFERGTASPQVLAREVMSQATCSINCFPVANRRLVERRFSLNAYVNLFELECDGFFHGVESVLSSRLKKEYLQHPFMKILEGDISQSRSYAIRRGGVNRFDERDGRAMLKNLIRYLREETYVFSALGKGVVSNNIKIIGKALNDLEEKLRKQQGANQAGKPGREPPVYIAFPAGEQEAVFVSYWESEGFAGNYIPAHTPLTAYGDQAWQADSIQLVSETLGGRDPHAEIARLQEFKSALITRNRIVTKADIRTFCFSELGEALAEVEVKPGVAVGNAPTAGLIRTLEVWLSPADSSDRYRWDFLRRQLEQQLNHQAAAMVPIHVKVMGQE